MKQIGFITEKEKKFNKLIFIVLSWILNVCKSYIPPIGIVFCLLFIVFHYTSKDLWVVYSAKSLDQIKLNNAEGNISIKTNIFQMSFTGEINNGTPIIALVNDVEYHLEPFELAISFYLKEIDGIPYGNGVLLSKPFPLTFDGKFDEVSVLLNDSNDNSIRIHGQQDIVIADTKEFFISPSGAFKLKIKGKEIDLPLNEKIRILPEPDYNIAGINIIAENPFYVIDKKAGDEFRFTGTISGFDSYSRTDSFTQFSDNTMQSKLETQNIIVNGEAVTSSNLRTDLSLNKNREDVNISGKVIRLDIGGKSVFSNFINWISSNTSAISTLIMTALIGILISRKN